MMGDGTTPAAGEAGERAAAGSLVRLSTRLSPKSSPKLPLAAHLEYKRVVGRLMGSDFGSGAHADLSYYEPVQEGNDGWLMLGHGIDSQMVLVKAGPLVRRVQRWKRCWSDAGSRKPKDYSIYIPECADPDFVACGVVFVFGSHRFATPRPGMPVGLVHVSMVEPAPPSQDFWSDAGTGATFSVALRAVPRIGTAWPSTATLIGQAPAAHTLRLCIPPAVAGAASSEHVELASPAGASPLPLLVRNTFVEDWALDGSPAESPPRRRALSWHPVGLEFAALEEEVIGTARTPCVGDSAGRESTDGEGTATTSHDGGEGVPEQPPVADPPVAHVAPAAIAQHLQLRSREPPAADSATPSPADLEHWAEAATAAVEPPPAPPRSGSSCRRPCDVILPQLELAEVCCLAATCTRLQHWPSRFRRDQPCRGDDSAAHAEQRRRLQSPSAVRSRKVFPFRPPKVWLGRSQKPRPRRAGPAALL